MPNIIFGIVCIGSGFIALLIPETNDLEMADQLKDVEDGFAASRRKSKPEGSNTDSSTEDSGKNEFEKETAVSTTTV